MADLAQELGIEMIGESVRSRQIPRTIEHRAGRRKIKIRIIWDRGLNQFVAWNVDKQAQTICYNADVKTVVREVITKSMAKKRKPADA